MIFLKDFFKPVSIICMLGLIAPETHRRQKDSYLRFSIKALLKEQKQTGAGSITFLKENTLTGKLLNVNTREKVSNAFKYDMLLYVIDGGGNLNR